MAKQKNPMKPDQWDGYIAICLRGIVTLTRPAHTIMRVLWEYSEQQQNFAIKQFEIKTRMNL